MTDQPAFDLQAPESPPKLTGDLSREALTDGGMVRVDAFVRAPAAAGREKGAAARQRRRRERLAAAGVVPATVQVPTAIRSDLQAWLDANVIDGQLPAVEAVRVAAAEEKRQAAAAIADLQARLEAAGAALKSVKKDLATEKAARLAAEGERDRARAAVNAWRAWASQTVAVVSSWSASRSLLARLVGGPGPVLPRQPQGKPQNGRR